MYDITVALCLGGLLIASVHALAVVLTVQLTRRGIVTAWHTKVVGALALRRRGYASTRHAPPGQALYALLWSVQLLMLL